MDTLILQSLSPAIAIALGVIAVMTQTAIRRHSDAALTISLVSLLIAVWAAFATWPASPVQATPLLIVDDYARLFTVVLTLAALVTIVVSRVWMVA